MGQFKVGDRVDVLALLDLDLPAVNRAQGNYAAALAAVRELIEAAKLASATLGHAYHTVLTGELAEQAHADYQRLDAALAQVSP